MFYFLREGFKKVIMKETELAQKFVEYLSAFDLYFEVDYHRSVDIVAISENISSAFEVKNTFNFKVFEQALGNKPHFNYSYICVPSFNDWIIQRKLCEDYGIGLLVYEERGYNDIRELVHPKLNRHTNNKRLFAGLHERNKRSLPGSKSGDSLKITAFGVTVENAVRYVRRHPGCTLKEMVDNIGHHYDSNILARKNLYQWIYKGVIKEIIWQPGGTLILSQTADKPTSEGEKIKHNLKHAHLGAP